MKVIPIFLLFANLFFQGAGQNRDSIIADLVRLQLTPTEIGMPVGEAVSQKIGLNGGKMISADNRIEIIIPAGALSTETLISIQPITNTADGGIGKSYNLEPSGIQFRKPVQITLHYTKDELEGNSPQLMNITFQDEKGVWYGLKKFKLDTSAKTIIGDINHFSDWGLSWGVILKAAKSRVKVSKTVDIILFFLPISDDDHDHVLHSEAQYGILGEKYDNPRIWSVNGIHHGDDINGIIKEEENFLVGNLVIYEAPATVPDINPVEISLKIKGAKSGTGDEKVVLVIKCKIIIYDSQYKVFMESEIKSGAGTILGILTYSDTGSFIISMEGKKTRLVDIKNNNDHFNYKGKCRIQLVSTGSGIIHVTGIKNLNVTPAKLPQQPYSIVEIQFVESNLVYTVLNISCTDRKGNTTTTNTSAYFTPMSAFPSILKFEGKEEEQIIYKIGKKGGEVYFILKVKQLKD